MHWIIGVVLFFNFIINLLGAEIDYKIVAPEFICRNSELRENNGGITTIRFLGEGELDFKLRFKNIGKTCQNTQRCNLLLWKVVREFEKYLNNYPYMQYNYIQFNNSMLVPGYEYILNIFVTQDNSRDQKQVTLNVVDDYYVKSAGKPIASITLIGVTSSEAHMAYVLNAETNICSDINDFYFLWKLLDGSSNLLEIFPDRSSELTIPPFTFEGGRQYNINCSLVSENSEVIAENTHTINVKYVEDTLLVKLPMLYTTVKVQQVIVITPYIVDLANQDEEIKKQWSCIYKDDDLCKNNNDEQLYLEGGFLNEGEYNISLTVTKGSEVKSVSCLIKVLKDVPSIEIDTVETPILPSSGTRIKANIDDLRTFCTVQWKSETGPYFIDLNSIPGNVDKIHRVVAKRDIFLRELEEFSNDVVNKEYSLIIPPPSGDWKGLPKLDDDYKLQFLLEVKCPKIQLQENEVEVEYSEDILNDTVTVSALVEVEIDVPPKLQLLEIEPSTGVGLETVFTFKCDEAIKNGVTSPFLYRFGFLLDDREFIFSNQLGFREVDTILPYGDDIKTFVEVCDGFNSCDKIFGPTIETSLPANINEENVQKVFKQKMNTEDFYKAFGYALSVLYTAKRLNEEEKYNELISNGIYDKIQYLLNSYDSNDEIWAKRVNKFTNNVQEFSKELSFSDEVLNGLVELREKLLLAQKERLLVLRRNLLSTNKRKFTFENFKSYIEVSDVIITSSTDKDKVALEKEILEKKIKEYLGRLCVLLYDNQQVVPLELTTLILVVEKLPRKSYNNMHVIPFEGNPWNTTAEIKIGAEALERMGKNKLCIAKMIFKDFFGKEGISYAASILDGSIENVTFENLNSTVLMPVDTERIVERIPKCIVYNNGWEPNCTFVKLNSKYAQCSCSTTGPFFLEYESAIPLTTVTTKVTIEADTVTESGEVTIVQSTKFQEISQKPVNHVTSPIQNDNFTTTKPTTITIISTVRDSTTTVRDSTDLITKGIDPSTLTSTDISQPIITNSEDPKTNPRVFTDSTKELNMFTSTATSDIKVTDTDIEVPSLTSDATEKSTAAEVTKISSSSYTLVSDSNISIVEDTLKGTTKISFSDDTTEDLSLGSAEVTTQNFASETTNEDTSVAFTNDYTTGGGNIKTSETTTEEILIDVYTIEGSSITEESTTSVTTVTLSSNTDEDIRQSSQDTATTFSDSPGNENTRDVSTTETTILDRNLPTDSGNKLSTETTKLFSTATTLAVQNVTKKKKKKKYTFGNVFQAGINVNFNANFSVNVSANKTFVHDVAY